MLAAKETENRHTGCSPRFTVITVTENSFIFADNIGIAVMPGIPCLLPYLPKAAERFFFRSTRPGLPNETALLDNDLIPAWTGKRTIGFSNHFRIIRQ